MSAFETETAIAAVDDSVWRTELSTGWNIGESANGGYAMTAVLRALCEVGDHPDPISVTTHFLRPVQGGGEGRIHTELIRSGRTVSVARGTLVQAGDDRLIVTTVLGDVNGEAATSDQIDIAAPAIPGPTECVARSGGAQGVELPITSRVEVRIPPERMAPGESEQAISEGWIRFVDGTPPSSLALPLFADAFPPTLFAKLGRVGWVPTIELTVHVRRRPADGWIQARFECDDLAGGRMIESGTLWDSTGRVVARSRQLGLLLT